MNVAVAHVLFLTDVLGQMGVIQFSGQIRVTQTGGRGFSTVRSRR